MATEKKLCEECKMDDAEFVCESCGAYYCKFCAEDFGFECDCEEPPKIVPISESKKM